MTRGRTSLWKIFKLQMHNSPTNVAYALSMQFCIMINRKIWKINDSKSDNEKISACLNLFSQTVLYLHKFFSVL